MPASNFNTAKNILVEVNALANLAKYLRDFQAKSVLLVTDNFLLNLGDKPNGLLYSAVRSLEQADISVTLFSDVEPDPSDTTVLSGVKMAKAAQVDLVLSIGGGSSLDVAKVISVLAAPSCHQQLSDLFGIDQITSERLPLVLVPTTAGTGSEVTPIAIITTGKTTKAGIVDSNLYADLAILDASLTLSLPKSATAATGIDAMVHAIEAYTSKIKKNSTSDKLAIEALKLLSSNIEVACKDSNNLKARENMLVGSMRAGQAFANAPVGGIHALAYPLGGHFHITHGLSNALVMVEVMRFNQQECARLYAELSKQVLELTGDDHKELSQKFIDYFENLIKKLPIPSSLAACNIPESSLELLACEAMLQSRLLQNNPRELNEKDALAIYQQAFSQ